MPIDRGSRKAHARAGRAGGTEGAKPLSTPPPVKRSVSRETEYDQSREELFRRTQADENLCAIARRTGFMLRTLLALWEGTLGDEQGDSAEAIRNALASAAEILVSLYAHTED